MNTKSLSTLAMLAGAMTFGLISAQGLGSNVNPTGGKAPSAFDGIVTPDDPPEGPLRRGDEVRNCNLKSRMFLVHRGSLSENSSRGVQSVASGYMGGQIIAPIYEQICTVKWALPIGDPAEVKKVAIRLRRQA